MARQIQNQRIADLGRFEPPPSQSPAKDSERSTIIELTDLSFQTCLVIQFKRPKKHNDSGRHGSLENSLDALHPAF